MATTKKSRLKLLHQYYKYTGFYSFIWQGVKKAIIPTAIIVAILFYINERVINLNAAILYATKNFSDFLLFTIFFISESILGLIPPDIFIAWTSTTSTPLVYLTILAFLSYFGGVMAYFMGKGFASIPAVNKYMYAKMTKH
ncbi:MAG TPA: short-chain dehydrogenase, partial [Flavobacterium sp.]|nr:short-chain dehydrogenase [Flavobacterium sp.]